MIAVVGLARVRVSGAYSFRRGMRKGSTRLLISNYEVVRSTAFPSLFVISKRPGRIQHQTGQEIIKASNLLLHTCSVLYMKSERVRLGFPSTVPNDGTEQGARFYRNTKTDTSSCQTRPAGHSSFGTRRSTQPSRWIDLELLADEYLKAVSMLVSKLMYMTCEVRRRYMSLFFEWWPHVYTPHTVCCYQRKNRSWRLLYCGPCWQLEGRRAATRYVPKMCNLCIPEGNRCFEFELEIQDDYGNRYINNLKFDEDWQSVILHCSTIVIGHTVVPTGRIDSLIWQACAGRR